jgi:LmbE family N-acetylglucosaminyl deacetylase
MGKHLLTIFAHPDDAETAAGGTLLKLAREGWRITLCLITDGDKGTSDPVATRDAVVATREVEQRRAAAILGADVIRLGHEDGMVQPTLELRRELVRVMRQVRPDRVIANDPTTWYRHGSYINHPDHRAAGQAVVEATYPAVKKASFFPELMAEGLEPHLVSELWLALPSEPDTWVDITEVLEDKIALICQHTSQFPPDPTRAVFSRIAREEGAARGMSAAETFHTFRLAASTVRALAGE